MLKKFFSYQTLTQKIRVDCTTAKQILDRVDIFPLNKKYSVFVAESVRSSSRKIFESTVLKKHKVNFYHCSTCDFLQTEEPYWCEEAYAQALNRFDTGVMGRNLANMKKVAPFVHYFIGHEKQFIDYAGGWGIFVRLMRDKGFDFFWADKYAENKLAQGFEQQEGTRYAALTSFEFFEHAIFPLVELDLLLHLAPVVIFSTLLRPIGEIPPSHWWYYGQEHGQHCSFFSLKTLQYMANEHHLALVSDGF